jgi:hypothetical protein
MLHFSFPDNLFCWLCWYSPPPPSVAFAYFFFVLRWREGANKVSTKFGFRNSAKVRIFFRNYHLLSQNSVESRRILSVELRDNITRNSGRNTGTPGPRLLFLIKKLLSWICFTVRPLFCLEFHHECILKCHVHVYVLFMFMLYARVIVCVHVLAHVRVCVHVHFHAHFHVQVHFYVHVHTCRCPLTSTCSKIRACSYSCPCPLLYTG